ncbi:hypothetical protein [Alkaliphilus oremlandii]|uniref:Uncharacterized protein n=1 Tax=Alkaliphilus oremlandii (strain OhILAs) TaxID=350688 RepID=A8MKM9_ALKOO|nr:hypothetical protein [Alkaliphilus oremlandii]ABW20361.1 hypothetical protein Clos_2830 [Alkaliphilus oremlandii OhILAs]
MKNITFKTSKLKDTGINSLIKKLGKIRAKAIELKDHVEIAVPSLSELAKIFVEALQPKYLQLSFHAFLNTA